MSKEGLRRDTLGVHHVVFFVIAAAAPLVGMLGAVPPAVTLGNGSGIPGAYLLAGLILLLFSVGYSAMSAHVVEAGAFYAYVALGLGRPAGAGAAYVAVLAYSSVQVALYGLVGFFGASIINPYLPVALPWFAYAFAVGAVVYVLGSRSIDVSGRLLGLFMTLEMGILVLLGAAILVHGGGPDGITLHPFSFAAVTSGHLGIAVMFAMLSFLGFEATAIYGAECRDPGRSVPSATYVSVVLITVFFTFVTWTVVCAYGTDGVVEAASTDPANFWFNQSTKHLGGAVTFIMRLLLLSSMFASALAFHNTIARYFFTLSQNGLLPSLFASIHPVHGSPAMASILQTATAFAAVGAFAVSGSDPYDIVFNTMSALSTIGILSLQVLVSLSVVVFFRRNRIDRRLWNTVVAPALGASGLAYTLVLVLQNLSVLSGADTTVVRSFPYLTAAAFIAGCAASFRRVPAAARSTNALLP